MTAPIDRIENVRAQVEVVERQMTMHQIAGVQLSPKFAWQLLSACKSLLGPTYAAEIAAAERRGAVKALRELAAAQDSWCKEGRAEQIISRQAMRDALNVRADQVEGAE